MLKIIFPGQIAAQIKKLLNLSGYAADQHQSNGAYGVHQLRARIPGDPTIYRVLVMPADAPLMIGTLPIDQHFIERIDESTASGHTAGTINERKAEPNQGTDENPMRSIAGDPSGSPALGGNP